MRIIVIDTDAAFTSSLTQRCKKANVVCQVITAASALAEIKKNPDGVDLVLISKELAGADGLVVAQSLRKDPATADVPYILMSSSWGKPEFAKHQKTEFGANAYYSKKSPQAELEATIEAVTGMKMVATATTGGAQHASSISLNIKLEAASDVVNISEDVPGDISMSQPIALFDEAEEPPSKAPEPAPAAPVVEASRDLKIEMGAAPGSEPPSSSATTGGIELNIASSDGSLNLESKIAAPEPAPPASEAAGEGIDLNVGGLDLQVETSTSVKSAVPTIEAPAEPAKDANLPQTDGSLFAIDLNAGEVALAEASAAPRAAQETPPAPSPAEAPASASVDEISLGGIEAAPAVPPVTAEAPAAEISIGDEAPVVAPADPVLAAAELAAEPPASLPVVAAAEPEPAVPSVSEEEAAQDLPYLFAGSSGLAHGAHGQTSMTKSGLAAPQIPPRNPADMPAVAGQSEDVETLKKYLMMREQDVSVLTAQLTYAKEELGKSDNTIKRLTLENEDLFHQINDLKKKNGEIEQELQHASKNRDGEVEQLRFEVKSKIDRIKFLEDRLNESAQQYEKLKERVRLDIRKIRVREKELESKLEILKKDSETLIAARENKILELKRKIDLLEFNYDTLQDKNDQEKNNVTKANEKIDRVLKVLKLAMGVIEGEQNGQPQEGQAGDTGAKVA